MDALGLLPLLLADTGLPGDPAREPLRVWAHSGVERLRFPGQASVVLKYADAPFDREHLALGLAARHGVPVPRVRASRTAPDALLMLLDDLGEPARFESTRQHARAILRWAAALERPGEGQLGARR